MSTAALPGNVHGAEVPEQPGVEEADVPRLELPQRDALLAAQADELAYAEELNAGALKVLVIDPVSTSNLSGKRWASQAAGRIAKGACVW